MQKFRTKDYMDLSHDTYITNNFDIQKPEVYEKPMTSEQAKEWAEVITKKMQSFIKYETWKLISNNHIIPKYRLLKRK